jgi:predicted acetyltransferase
MLSTMGDPVIRLYQDADWAQHAHVRSMVYRGAVPIRADEKLIPDDALPYVAELDGQIVGSALALRMTASRGGQSAESAIACGGVASVAVLPEYRKTGVGGALMTQILRLMRGEGLALASLYPFRNSYYRRFGYESCGRRVTIKSPEMRLPKFKSDLKIRQLDAKEWEQLLPAYRGFSAQYSGMNDRRPEQWKRQFGGDNPMTVYAAGDPVEAYCVTRMAWDFWAEHEIKEVIWSTRRGYEAIMGLISSLCINKTQIIWTEPSDGPFCTSHLDQAEHIEIVPSQQTMFRLLDAVEALKALRPTGNGEFAVEIRDEALPENTGPWHVRFSPDGVEVEKTDRWDLSLDVRAFVQALLGEPSLAALVRMEAVEVISADALAAANRLLPGNPVYCADLF